MKKTKTGLMLGVLVFSALFGGCAPSTSSHSSKTPGWPPSINTGQVWVVKMDAGQQYTGSWRIELVRSAQAGGFSGFEGSASGNGRLQKAAVVPVERSGISGVVFGIALGDSQYPLLNCVIFEQTANPENPEFKGQVLLAENERSQRSIGTCSVAREK